MNSPPPCVAPCKLVFGASGYVGTNLVPALLDAGYRVRAAARNRSVLAARDWPGVDLVEADALQPQSLPTALRGVHTAYYLVHSMAAGSDFAALDLRAAGNFAAAAADAGVQHIVYLGGLVPAQAESQHLVSRRETGERLRAGPVPVTEIRAGVIVGPGSAAYEVIRDLVYHLPLMLTPRWVRSRSAPIALANLIEYLLRVPPLTREGGIFDAAGPEMLSYEELMLQFGEIVGRRPRIVPVPVLSPRLSSYWLGLITTVPAPVARALIDGLKHDIPADDCALRRLVPQRLLSFREAVAEALAAERQQRVPGRWTEGAFALRRFRHDYAFYAKRAGADIETAASPRALWRVVTSLGGSTGYFTMNWIWKLREGIDWLLGGRGFMRGRRDPQSLRLGDAIDYWTVVGLQPDRLLTLDFGLKAPGAGILEFVIDPLPGGRARLSITAYWHPQGFWGLLYWAVLVPFHIFIFKRMVRAIVARAEGSVPEAGCDG